MQQTQESAATLWQRLAASEWLAPEHIAVRGKWLEVVAISVLFMGVTWTWRPSDPLLTQSAFPWLWLAPVLLALRYGVMPGLIGGFLILGNWFIAYALGVAAVVQSDFPRDYFFGGGLLILLCGEFSDVWRDRIGRMDETNLYLTERLSRLTRRHLLLNLSHDRMEQEMLARPGSLRDALTKVRNLVLQEKGRDDPILGVTALLDLLAQYVSIESAAVYGADAVGDKDHVLGPILQSIGEPWPLRDDDELLLLALEKRNLAHISDAEVSHERKSNQLIVAPLIASDDTLMGVMTVSKIPFSSLNVENLQMMSVILAYYADHIHNADDVILYRSRMPTIPATFAEEVARMVRMQKKVGITSHIVVMTFSKNMKADIPGQFLQIKRGLDLYWQTEVNGCVVLAVMMPFANAAAKNGFLLRIDAWLRATYDGGFEALQIRLRSIDFSRENPLLVLPEVVES
jgi:polysaccharide biosynthesis protein PelD